ALAARADDLHESLGQVGRGTRTLLQDRAERDPGRARRARPAAGPGEDQARRKRCRPQRAEGHPGAARQRGFLAAAPGYRPPGREGRGRQLCAAPAAGRAARGDREKHRAIDTRARPAARRQHGARDDEDPRETAAAEAGAAERIDMTMRSIRTAQPWPFLLLLALAAS